jgi:hypothetical protein
VNIREIKPKANESLCALLRDILARAESGEVLGFVGAFTLTGNETATALAVEGVDIAHLFLAIERVKFNILLRPFEEIE